MTTRAVVLGGGGPVGIAWEAGLIAGLAQAGVRVGDAEQILGTSAGAAVGALLALGWSPEQLLSALAVLSGLAATPSPAAGAPSFMDVMQWAATGGASREAALAEVGALALSAQTMSEDAYLANFASTLGPAPWPGRRFGCVAVDTASGVAVTWEDNSGVELARAVASSTAVPGVFPPITINGRRYMDGGVRSSTNADLAVGAALVLIVAIPIGTDPAMLDAGRVQREREMGTLRAAGATVALIMPDAASLEAMGADLMDAGRALGAVQAAIAQGAREAAALRDQWGGSTAPAPSG